MCTLFCRWVASPRERQNQGRIPRERPSHSSRRIFFVVEMSGSVHFILSNNRTSHNYNDNCDHNQSRSSNGRSSNNEQRTTNHNKVRSKLSQNSPLLSLELCRKAPTGIIEVFRICQRKPACRSGDLFGPFSSISFGHFISDSRTEKEGTRCGGICGMVTDGGGCPIDHPSERERKQKGWQKLLPTTRTVTTLTVHHKHGRNE